METKFAIIGGGPIGLFTAIKLAEKGQRVDLFEKSSWPRDKVCGQGIMPSGMKCLHDIGIDFNTIDESFEFKGISYFENDKKISGLLTEPGRGIERQTLSKKLYEKALSLKNINLFPNSHIKDPIELSRKYEKVFVCDGLLSPTRKYLNLEVNRNEKHRMGARLHFNQNPWSQNVEVYWSNGVEAYVTPTSDSSVEVAFLWYKDKLEIKKNLEEVLFSRFPSLVQKLEMKRKRNDFRAYGPFKMTAKKMSYKNFVFLGDAYMFLDGITGEGLSLGMKTASIICEAPYKFSLWQKIRIAYHYQKYAFFVRMALSLSLHKGLRQFIFSITNRRPAMFQFFVRLNDY